MNHHFHKLAAKGGLPTLLLLSTLAPSFAAEQVEIADELERLARAHGFTLVGVEQTRESLGTADGEELYPRLRRLLENFDHVIVQNAAGGVDRVIVLGEKIPYEPPPPALPESAEDKDIEIQTERRGNQRLVRVSLAGKAGSKVERQLQVDTGADYLVLPLSLIETLGVDKGALKDREMQTANGKVQARVGILPSLWLGEHHISNVETAFIEDDKIGNSGLLGMSVLGRYTLTIDDADNNITLGKKDENSATEQGDEEETDRANTGTTNR